MKKTAVIIVCFLVVAAGYIIFRQKSPVLRTVTGNGNTPASETAEVSMRQDEYVPSVLTIKKGTTVIFKNDSPDWRWPASNLHPTHDIYPEFDPKEPVAAGKSWSFRFDKAGSWNMHDHLAPYITGTITVQQ